jgi:hypothetical protein
VVLLEAAVVVGLFALVIFATIQVLTRAQVPRRTALPRGTWQVAHLDAAGETRVVLQKVGADGGVVDEHVIARIRVDDPEYDAKFLAAMAAARERRALFESEEEP